MKKILKGFNNKYVINLFKSLGIFCTLMATSSCSDNLVYKNNKGSEKMLPSEPSQRDDSEVIYSSSIGDSSLEEYLCIDNENQEKISLYSSYLQTLSHNFNISIEEFYENFHSLDKDFNFYCIKCIQTLESFYEYCNRLDCFFLNFEKGILPSRVSDLIQIHSQYLYLRGFVRQSFLNIQKIFKGRLFNTIEKEKKCYQDLYKTYCKLISYVETHDINESFQLGLLIT